MHFLGKYVLSIGNHSIIVLPYFLWNYGSSQPVTDANMKTKLLDVKEILPKLMVKLLDISIINTKC
jgi:hypothetical protein